MPKKEELRDEIGIQILKALEGEWKDRTKPEFIKTREERDRIALAIFEKKGFEWFVKRVVDNWVEGISDRFWEILDDILTDEIETIDKVEEIAEKESSCEIKVVKNESELFPLNVPKVKCTNCGRKNIEHRYTDAELHCYRCEECGNYEYEDL